MLIVQKYGGTSLAGMSRLRAAARRVTGLARQGNQVVVVVSAQGDTTDMLIEKATQVNRRGSAREMDAYLAAGEQMSAGLMTMAIGAMGYSAVSLTGWQAGIRTDGVHGNARIQNIDVARIRRQLDAGKIVVVAGFQGVDPEGDITTLGRGGSDTTAVALAAWLKADRCQIFTDVDGVYDRDPRIYSDATRFGQISYAKMMTLIENGAQVLHDRSVALAARHGVTVEVRSCEEGSVGTLVVPRAESGEVTGVTRSRRGEVTRVTAIGRALPSLAAIRAAVSALEAAGITVLGLEEGEQRVTLLVKRDDEDAALCAVHDALVPR